jgi:hypothetical protein
MLEKDRLEEILNGVETEPVMLMMIFDRNCIILEN